MYLVAWGPHNLDVRNVCIMGEKKLKFYILTGGCHIPFTHAAIDKTLTTILFSIPNEISSVLR